MSSFVLPVGHPWRDGEFDQLFADINAAPSAIRITSKSALRRAG
jgi:hypothetical protein